MPEDFAILAEDVSKVFRFPTERRDHLKEHVTQIFRPLGHSRFEALRSVDLQVKRGEFFSIIGQNGSGKSTLLKILAGIYTPTRGRVTVDGRLSPFIELGVGFNPELTARDNVFLNGTILGLKRKDLQAQFDSIIAFAELEQFTDLKVKNFSSGMLVRLAFSVAIRAHAEILLIDEVLAVGDSNFQMKCFEVFRRLRAEGKTIVFVSHDLASVKEFSDRVMVLDQGRAVGVYLPSAGITEYLRLAEEKANRDLAASGARSARRSGEGSATPTIREIRMLTADGKPTRIIHRGDSIKVVLEVSNPERRAVHAGVSIFRTDGIYCFGTNTILAEVEATQEDDAEITVDFQDIPLQRGGYYLVVGLFGESTTRIYDFQEHAYDFQVAQWDQYEGLAYVHHEWKSRTLSDARRGYPGRRSHP